MKHKEQKMEIHRLMSSTSSIVILFDVYRRKDYNRLVHKLRRYQSLALFLKPLPLVEFQELQKMHSNLRDIENSIKQIGLSVDEMAEDGHSLGLNYFSDVLEHLMQSFRILHDHLVKEAKQNLYNNRLEHLKLKKVKNICDQCSEAHEAVHLKRLKTSFGMLQPEGYQRNLREEFLDEREELDLREKADFIDELNNLLQRKTSIANMNINPRKYKELVDCLQKLDKIDRSVGKKVQKQDRDGKILQDVVEQTDQELQNKYSSIIEQVKNILNSKFREGYSHRIRKMLDKFEIVFKNDQLKGMQGKNMVNVHQQGIQTMPTAKIAQLQLIREEVASRDAELAGIKQARKRIQEKYLNLLESQRRVSREAMAYSAKNEKLLRQLQQRDKIIDKMSHELGRQKADRIRKFDLFNLHQLQQDTQRTPAKSSDSSRNNEKKAIASANNQTVNKVAIQHKHIQTQTQIMSEHGFPEPKKRHFKLIKRFTISNNSSNFIRTFSDQEDKGYKIHRIFTYCIQPQPKVDEQNTLRKTSGKNSAKQKNKSKSKEDAKKGKSLSKKNKKKQKQNTKNKSAISKQKTKQALQYNKSIDVLHKQDADKIILQRSQKSIQESQASFNRNENKRSSIFTVRDSKTTQRRDSKNMSNIRLTELPQYFRLNHIKTDSSKTKDESAFNSNINLKQNTSVNPATSIVRINKYQKKTSTTMDRDRVRQIVHLLKVQKQNLSKRSAFRPQSGFQSENKVKNVVQLAEQQLREQEKEEDGLAKQDVVQTIQNLKMLIESQYTYLKASGFINFLLSFQKKPALVNRNLIKYKFQFTHLTQNQLYLFGGIEEMVRFSQNVGVWERYFIDENDLKVYYKHMNFAHKISKYFLLLKKMNQQFFEEYVSFISDPLNFSLTHFGPNVSSSIHALLSEGNGVDKDIILSNEMNWKKIMMRLIRFHHQCHKNCKHIVEFLDKIGYYRYSI